MKYLPATFEDLKAAYLKVTGIPEKIVSPYADGPLNLEANPLDCLYVQSVMAGKEMPFDRVVWAYQKDVSFKLMSQARIAS